MEINNISSYELIEMLWKKLPDNGLGGGKGFVVVDIDDGEVYSIYEPQGEIITQQTYKELIFVLAAASKSEIISDWVLDEHIIDWDEIQRGKTRYDLHEDELYSCVLDVLHEWFEKEIEEAIQELLQKYPHLQRKAG